MRAPETVMSSCCFPLWPVADMFAISDERIALDELRDQVMDPGSGGLCVFEGWVRNENDGF